MNYTWDKISLENYAAIDALTRSKPSDAIDQGVSLLSLANDKPESYYMDLPLPKLVSEIESLNKFLSKPIEGKLKKTFWCKGRRFKVCILNVDDVKGKHREALNVIKLDENNLAEKCHLIVAAITDEITPIRKHLSTNDRAELFNKHLPTSIGMGICLFFWNFSNELTAIFLPYLEREVERLKTELEQMT